MAVVNGLPKSFSIFVCKTAFVTLDTPFEIRGRIAYWLNFILGMDFIGIRSIVGSNIGFFRAYRLLAFRSFLGLRSSLMIAGISSFGVCAKAVISASVALICPVSISSIAPGTAASAASTPFAYFSARCTNLELTPFLLAIRSQVRFRSTSCGHFVYMR